MQNVATKYASEVFAHDFPINTPFSAPSKIYENLIFSTNPTLPLPLSGVQMQREVRRRLSSRGRRARRLEVRSEMISKWGWINTY